MRNAAALSSNPDQSNVRPDPREPNPVELDAETDRLGDSSDDSSDCIPENLLGECPVDPDYDGSEPPLSQPVPAPCDSQAKGSNVWKGVAQHLLTANYAFEGQTLSGWGIPFSQCWSLQVAALSGSDCSSGIWPSDEGNHTSPGAVVDAASDLSEGVGDSEACDPVADDKREMGNKEESAPAKMSMEERG